MLVNLKIVYGRLDLGGNVCIFVLGILKYFLLIENKFEV